MDNSIYKCSQHLIKSELVEGKRSPHMAKSSFVITVVVIFYCICSLVVPTKCYHHYPQPLEDVIASLFIFGDSLFDAGNNNYINTPGQANYYPYGETFFKYPSGRFCDGRIIPDFIAECAKLPLIPPYLYPGNYDFRYGVNFASSGSGALTETRQGFVIDLKTQLGYFKNVSNQLKQQMGYADAKTLLSRAVYVFSVGNNDYLFPFDTNTTILNSYTTKQYVGMVIGNITQVTQEIYNIGGRKFGFLNLAHLGCTPSGRVLEGGNSGACFEKFTPFVKLHNTQLSMILKELHTKLKGFRYSLVDFYSFSQERLNNPSKYGFKEAKEACCGSGPYRGYFSCGGRRGVKEYELCENVTDYVFFDSTHPTEKINMQFTREAWNGKPGFSGPYNLKALFQSN
ncbi:GDSL esterase/lipase 1-like [Humulus lupulus]|uniref:GDSL esterase/lipase 1-like n=1 Tax=Humulus lupulus TaxID=3486 RepID=UPI002B40BBFB|nr:GDSL esterase/lipase 1-like [Humulus lupulus]